MRKKGSDPKADLKKEGKLKETTGGFFSLDNQYKARWSMKSMIYKLAMLLVLVTLFVPLEGEAQKEKKKFELKKRQPDIPLSVFSNIEKAWREGDSEKLVNLASGRKVYLYIKESGYKEGYYSPSQARYIFRRIFKQNRQLKFRFVKYYNLEEPRRRIYGVVQRSYENIRSGKLFRDKLYVALKKEGDRWVIARIKSNW